MEWSQGRGGGEEVFPRASAALGPTALVQRGNAQSFVEMLRVLLRSLFSV